MSYEVIWRRAAENELADIWMKSNDRGAINRASATLDRLLEHEGPNAGESRIGYWRIAHEAPLGIYFFAASNNTKVIVIHVWEYH